MKTFEELYFPLWEAFVAFSQDLNNTDEDVVRAERQFDLDVEELAQKFSHPPGTPNRRR